MVTPEGGVHPRPEVGECTVAKLEKLIPFDCVVPAGQRAPESHGVVHKLLGREKRREIV